MDRQKFTKLEVAINQLEMAIDLFLKNKDFICVITLAGAAKVQQKGE